LPNPVETQLALADLFRAMADQLRYDAAAARLLADLQREEGGIRPQPVSTGSRRTVEVRAPAAAPSGSPRRQRDVGPVDF